MGEDMQTGSLPQMMTHEHNQKHRRVWVPYNKKLKLKGLQSNMQTMSNQSRSIGKAMGSTGPTTATTTHSSTVNEY